MRLVDSPAPGPYALRLVRGGVPVAARIEHANGLWSASLDGTACGAPHADWTQAPGVTRIHLWGEPINEAEYAGRVRRGPAADPALPVDLRRHASLF